VGVEALTVADLARVIASSDAFWGQRPPPWHHPLFARQLGEGALLVRVDGEAVAYLLGMLATDDGGAYVHVVATHRDHRGRGYAALLYDEFERRARRRGAAYLSAITRPDNQASLGFHAARGMAAELVDDYGGDGQPRVVFRKRFA
jgi:ribosomal protein S18 acetylase RimI-like enzyme